MNKQNISASIDTFIADLLTDDTSEQQSVAVATSNKSSAGTSPADGDNRLTVDERYFNSTHENYTDALPANEQYLSFTIESTGYIVAEHNVVTVKANLDVGSERSYSQYDAAGLLNEYSIAAVRQRKYLLILKSDREYAIGVDAIDGLVRLPASDLVYKKEKHMRPWLAGLSRDFQHVLINPRLVDMALAANAAKYLVGTNSANTL